MLVAGVVFSFSIDNSVGMPVDSAKSNNDEVFLPVLGKNKIDSQKETFDYNVLALQNNSREISTMSSANLVSKTSEVVNLKEDMVSVLFNGEGNPKLKELEQDIPAQLEEKIRDVSNQIDEMNREIAAASYYIQKDQKLIDTIQREIDKTQKQIDTIQREIGKTQQTIYVLQQQAIYQNQGMNVLSKRINEVSQDIGDLKRTVTVLVRLMQLTPCPVVPGFAPQAPFYPVPQQPICSMPQQQVCSMPQQQVPEQQKPINQPLP